MREWKVKPGETGDKLQNFIRAKLGDVSARQIKKWIESNLCRINGRTERFASAVLGAGDTVALDVVKTSVAEQSGTEGLASPDRILYEDFAILIYDKPAGLTSDDPRLLAILSNGRSGLALAHRLDRDTTGVLLFGKTPEALRGLEGLFKARKINKTYLAICDGIPKQHSGVIENYLGKLKVYQGQTLWGEVPKAKGSIAKTTWYCERKGSTACLMRCAPETGRTHQIRVHLSSIGHPILGDHQYGKDFRCPFRPKRCLLHALSVSFVHPETDQQLVVEAPIPADFLAALGKL